MGIRLMGEEYLDLTEYKRLKLVPGEGGFALARVVVRTFEIWDFPYHETKEVESSFTVDMTEEQATAMLERLNARIESGQLQSVHPRDYGMFWVIPPGYYPRRREKS